MGRESVDSGVRVPESDLCTATCSVTLDKCLSFPAIFFSCFLADEVAVIIEGSSK